MAEDTNKKSAANGENKDWEWDAQAPENPIEAIELTEAPRSKAVDEKAVEEDNSPAQPQDGCCIICGEKLRKSPSELYCNVCREKYMKVNFGARHIILSIVMMFVAVFGIVSFSTTTTIVGNIFEGDRHLKNEHIAQALDSYNSVEATVMTLNQGVNAFLQGISSDFKTVEAYDSGVTVDKKTAELMIKTMSSDYTDREAFMSLVDTAFTPKELASEKYAHIKKCYDFCKAMDDTANNIYEGWYTLLNERLSAFDENGKLPDDKEVPTLDEVIAYLDDYAEKNPDAEKSTIEHYKVLTLYYEFSSFDTIDPNDIFKYVQSACDKAGEYSYFYSDYYLTFAWESENYDLVVSGAEDFLKVNSADHMSYFYLTKTYAHYEDWDKASATCEQILKYNPDSLDYYALKSEVLRRSGDFNAAIDICTKGEKVGDDAEILRQKSIAYMLNGEKDKALDTADKAYQMTYAASYSGGTISLEVLNTSALISYLCDSEKIIYNETVETLKGENITLEPSVQQVIDGKTTFEELFMSNKGDI